MVLQIKNDNNKEMHFRIHVNISKCIFGYFHNNNYQQRSMKCALHPRDDFRTYAILRYYKKIYASSRHPFTVMMFWVDRDCVVSCYVKKPDEECDDIVYLSLIHI